jgi:hypothetical protein
MWLHCKIKLRAYIYGFLEQIDAGTVPRPTGFRLSVPVRNPVEYLYVATLQNQPAIAHLLLEHSIDPNRVAYWNTDNKLRIGSEPTYMASSSRSMLGPFQDLQVSASVFIGRSPTVEYSSQC